MKKLLLATLAAMVLCAPARAADNAVILTPGTGVTMRSIDVGAGVQAMGHVLVGTTGAAIYGTAGTANANVLTVQGAASMTSLFVAGAVASAAADSGNPVKIGGKYNASPVTLTDGNRGDAQLDVNGYLKVNVATATGLAQGSTTSGQTGSLILGAVTTAAPAYTNAQSSPLSLTTGGGLRADVATWAGTAAVTGSGNATGALRVEVANNGTGLITANPATAANWGVGATASAVPANAKYSAVNVGGNLKGLVGDPCQVNAATWATISITTATTTRIIAPSASNRTYICYMYLQNAAADNIGIVEGTGGTCGTGTAGVVGGTTAANGPNNAANSGQAFGNGSSAVLATAGTNVDFCLITSAATPLAGHVKYVQAP